MQGWLILVGIVAIGVLAAFLAFRRPAPRGTRNAGTESSFATGTVYSMSEGRARGRPHDRSTESGGGDSGGGGGDGGGGGGD